MLFFPGIFQKTIFCQIVLLLFSSSAMAVPMPLRLDLYDGSDNHLMYITFRYDAGGRNIGRSMFMADTTFMRNVTINYDDLGRRGSEVSYDFNGDTMYTTNYLNAENKTSFSIRDQFNQDLAGDRIAYSSADPLNFGLTYEQTGDKAAAVKYTKDDVTGQLKRVDIAGQSGSDSYYGLFSYGEAIGVSHTGSKAWKFPPASLQLRASRIEVGFNLQSAGDVRCELLTLSGRRAAVLFSGKVPTGSTTRLFNIDKDAGHLSNGVYLIKISVNGAGVVHSRYLHQSSGAGGVR